MQIVVGQGLQLKASRNFVEENDFPLFTAVLFPDFLLLFFFSLIISVLDLNAFERQNKAEGLGMVTEEGTRKQNEIDSSSVSNIICASFFNLNCCLLWLEVSVVKLTISNSRLWVLNMLFFYTIFSNNF